MPVADQELLRRVVRRDSTALTELERRHRPSLYAQVYAILMDSTLAERVVREVFARLWFAAERFLVEYSLWSWLRMTAKDLARAARHSSDEIRRKNENSLVHPGPARPRVGDGADADDSELPRIRYRKGESGRGDGPPRDACAW